MSQITKTMKLHLHPADETVSDFSRMTQSYAEACNYVSQYVFDNGFPLNSNEVQKYVYSDIRSQFALKSQLAVSVCKTVTARYKTVREQLIQNPYKYKGENSEWVYVPRTLEWLWKPVQFRRPQADLVRGRDYSFVDGGAGISVNTLGRRAVMKFDEPACFRKYFEDDGYSFGTGKLVSLKGEWYLHIPVTFEVPDTFDDAKPSHAVGIDRGLRFIAACYDEKGRTLFVSGAEIMRKRQKFADVRAELQAKGTKSAKRVLKRISGRENRWMTDVNHQISKTLVQKYGPDTLFVLEDLTGVSFSEENLGRNAQKNREIRTWSFYQLEQFLRYKASENGSKVITVSPGYTSQRCPKCGRIHKENRHHDIHEYICDGCGYRSNDDRVGAMNIYILGTMYISGDANPRFGIRKIR